MNEWMNEWMNELKTVEESRKGVIVLLFALLEFFLPFRLNLQKQI